MCKSVDGSLAQLGGRKTQAHAVSLPPSPAQVGRIHGGPDWASESAWGKAVSLELGKRVQPGPGWGVDVHSVLHPLKPVRPDMALEPHNLLTKYLSITKVTSQGRCRQTPP